MLDEDLGYKRVGTKENMFFEAKKERAFENLSFKKAGISGSLMQTAGLAWKKSIGAGGLRKNPR
jgi:hypothetical protein